MVRNIAGYSTKKDLKYGFVNLSVMKRLEIKSKLLNPKKKYLVFSLARTKYSENKNSLRIYLANELRIKYTIFLIFIFVYQNISYFCI